MKFMNWFLLPLIYIVLVCMALPFPTVWGDDNTEAPASIENMTYPLPDIPSFVVLPFQNMVDDPDLDFLSGSVLVSAENKPNPAIPLLLLDTFRLYDLDEVVDAIFVNLAEDEGFDAVVLALDKGYSVRQIVQAGLPWRLSLTGDITDSSGKTENPEYPPSGVIIPDSAVVVRIFLSEAAISPKTTSEVRDISKEEAIRIGYRALSIIFSLADQGYSPEQILEVFYVPTYRIDYVDPSQKIITVFDENGFRLQPERQPEHFVFSNTLGPIFASKTVYWGDDKGEKCPGDSKFAMVNQGDIVTYCFEIRNYSSSELVLAQREPYGPWDNTFYFGDDNFEAIEMTPKSGSLPLKPDERLVLYDIDYVIKSEKTCMWAWVKLPKEELKNSASCTSIMPGKPGYPYADVSLVLKWDEYKKKAGEPISALGIAAVKDTMDNFVEPLDKDKVLSKFGFLKELMLAIPNGGHYIIVVWIYSLAPQTEVVPFELTVRVTPYKWDPVKMVKDFADKIEYNLRSKVEKSDSCPIFNCHGYQKTTSVIFQTY